ncbi:MAG: Gfo/Idh/MocA family protein [Christensenellales bacterium]
MEKLKMGIIGTGGISNDLHFMMAYKDNPKVELYAISDVDEELLAKRAKEWGVSRAFTDYRALLAIKEIDAVEVIVPPFLHAEIAIAAMEAGKHVSVQKPMAITLEDCDAMIEAAERTGKIMRVFENFMYYPPLVKAKELLDAGAIGEPLGIRMRAAIGSSGIAYEIPVRRWAWRFDPKRGGGGRVIFDYGYHLFNVARWFIGDVEKVSAMITYRKVYDRDDWEIDCPNVVIWKYKDAEKYGCYEAFQSDDLIMEAKYNRPEDEWFEISGSKGFIWVNSCTNHVQISPSVVVYRDKVTTSYDLDDDWGTSFKLGINDFFDAIIEKRQPPLTGKDGRRVMQFCRAIELSGREHREVTLDEIV